MASGTRQAVIQEAAHSAVFGLLAVLDDVRIIDDTRGHLESFHVAGGRVLINPPDRDLQDLLAHVERGRARMRDAQVLALPADTQRDDPSRELH